MASSSNDPDSLVTLHFHDFRVERMRHWWTLLGEDDHADIVGFFGKFPPFMRLQVDRGLLEALASFWDPTHCCFSIGEVDLVPTMEEYAELLQLDRPFSETPVIPIQGPRSNRCLEKYLGLTYCSSTLLGTSLRARRGGRNSESMPSRSPFAGDRERGFRCSAHSSFQLWFCSHLRHFYRLQTPYHFERHTVTWGPAVWKPWTHCALFDGVPLPGVWGCTGYYPSLALRQFGGVQYPPRLGDLDAVTFDYIPSEDMWRLLSRVEVIWEGRLSEAYCTARAHHILWCLALFGCQPPLSLCGVPCIITVWRWRIFAATWRLRGGNVSTLRTMNEFIREQLEISEDAKESAGGDLGLRTREQLETEQAERTRSPG
uniref:DUF7745 domain-containing protein n=1 Tax=Fagus sylvatica TaxID=28930 RepID=A0A2N9EXS4_FAGSY